ncbi:hypothetical protein V6N13_146634 [Hibiscus sabdariffa]
MEKVSQDHLIGNDLVNKQEAPQQNKSGTGGLVIVKTNGETPQLSVVHNHSLELGSNRVMGISESEKFV